ncbi:hypothetical protein [Ruegeria atlantica]|uniref:hypothetical protein n=1 Tax=Ruegeria atlantica TaxID=81569 RepID=UPI00147B22B0|nr:hypothetical protein [Ruegeria atlantica]
MKPLPLLILMLACAGCTDIPELEGRELPELESARYPKLIPLQENLGPAVDPVNEAAVVEEDLIARREELEKKSEELQNAEIN